MASNGKLEYWQVNVPEAERPATCPIWLQDANDATKHILSTPDSEYHRLDWGEVKDIIRRNRLELFHRVPSDLRRYIEYMYNLKRQWGSVMEFVVKERVQWDGQLQPKGKPFDDPSDIKILFNDWPYGIALDIVHLVVWTKFELAEDPTSSTGDLTPEARREIDDFVGRVFRSRMPSENVVWFKNWKALKSIEAVEHFHVLLNKPDRGFLAELTNGDVAMADKLKAGKE